MAIEREGPTPDVGRVVGRPSELDRRTVLKLLGGTAALGAAPASDGGGRTRAAEHGTPTLPAGAAGARPCRSSSTGATTCSTSASTCTTSCSTLRRRAGWCARSRPSPLSWWRSLPFQQVAEEAVQSPPAPPWPASPLDALGPGTEPARLHLAEVGQIPALHAWPGCSTGPDSSPAGGVARTVPNATPAAPGALQTFVEAPWQLFFSPDQHGRWHHSATPVTHGIWSELWQTRLGVGNVEPPASVPFIRRCGHRTGPVSAPRIRSSCRSSPRTGSTS